MTRFNPAWLLAFGLVSAFAQDPNQAPPPEQPTGGWRKFGDQRPPDAPPYDQRPAYDQQRPAYDQQRPAYDQQRPPYDQQRPYGQRPQDPRASQEPMPFTPPPPTLAIPAGAWITVRVDQPLSSDHNQPGDAFTGTLVQPLVSEGRIVARRGQMVAGRVSEVQKAGRTQGTSRLGIEITEIGLVDGQQLPVHTRLMERHGDTSIGRDVGGVGATAGVGAALGGAAGGGLGAGIGALAGAGAGTIGVLATRGKATVVYPETMLMFRLDAPVTISTEHSAQAFEQVGREDYGYDRPPSLRQGPAPQRGPSPYYAPAPYYGPGPYYYGSYYSPYYYGGGFFGPSFFFSSGPRFYGGGRGYYRRR